MDGSGTESGETQVPGEGGGESAEVRAFLIADVRGYTLFTQERGDEAAGKLAGKFARIAREAVDARGGSVIELRGDEALAVFGSPRQAIRAAIEMQGRFVDETLADPSLPLPVGIGLDAGEAVAVEGGYRGGALNQAARLCGQAGPGEVLASQEVVHMARKVDGVEYEDRGEVHLKGLAEPVRMIRVFSEHEDARERMASLAPKPSPMARSTRQLPKRRQLIAGLVAVVVLATVVTVVVSGHHGAPISAISVEPDSVAELDAATGRVVGDVPAGSRPSAIASGDGAVWVANPAAGTVSRIDPSGRRVSQTIQVDGTPVALAVGYRGVWVVNGDGRTVFQINPDANRVVLTITVGNGPDAIAAGAGGIWVVNGLDDTVSEIDPRTGVPAPPIAVGSHPSAVVVEGGSVWVANSTDGTVVKITPGSKSVSSPIHVGNGPAAMAAGGGSIWVANSLDETASRIDASKGTVTATVPVGDSPGSLAVADGSTWVANQFGGTLSRIGPGETVPHTIQVGNAPQGVAALGGNLWVAVASAGTTHRGGTLRVESSIQAPDSSDPALAYLSGIWSMLTITNDGLVGFRRVGGPDGATIVPDLATSVPAPTDGGKTYTFQLRPGIRYSNGHLVMASDFRNALERGFRNAPTAYYQGIVGGAACAKDPSTCDLSEGVVAHDGSGTVTFHLVAPDSEFLFKLALPFADAVPAGTPAPTLTSIVPATGPYEIQSYTPIPSPLPSTTSSQGTQEGTLVLVRNPQFREWSAAAQPHGYPDRIVWTFGLNADQVITDIEQGRADASLDPSPPPGRLQEITTRFTNQAYPFSLIQTYGIALNINLPPFNKVRVRRAVNYAFDRGAVARELQTAVPTCQLIPPNFPGYRPYCPYTLNPSPDGTWTARDLHRARQLVAASPTKGMKVTVWAPGLTTGPILYLAGRALVTALKDLGYHATLRTIPNVDQYFQFVGNSDNRVQAAGAAWGPDYPAASNFVTNTMTCKAGANLAHLCDPVLTREVPQALSVQDTDPAAANGLWEAIDRRITKDAPWVFAINPGGVDFVSARVGNYQRNLQWGILLGQLWVK